MGQIVSDVTDILNYNENKKKANAEKKEILEQIASNNTEKKNLVKKTLAAQRAKYGTNGVAEKNQTADTVLSRLKSETEKPFDEKNKTNINKLKTTKAAKKNMLKTLLEHFDKLLG